MLLGEWPESPLPRLPDVGVKRILVERLGNVANSTRCQRSLNSECLIMIRYIVQRLHKHVFTPTLCTGRGGSDV